MTSSPHRAQSGARVVRPTWRRCPATVSERASRAAGSAIEAAAISSPTSAAPVAHRIELSVSAPNDPVPNALLPISSAAPRPSATPRIAGDGVSASASRTSVRRRRAAGAQQRGVSPAAIGSGGCDQRGQQSGQDGAGHAEEQEQDLRVQRIPAGAVQRDAEIVADDARSGSRLSRLCARARSRRCTRRRAWRGAGARAARGPGCGSARAGWRAPRSTRANVAAGSSSTLSGAPRAERRAVRRRSETASRPRAGRPRRRS